MDPTDPIVSIVIPTRNRINLLKECLQSVKAQTYLHYEVIVVDDGSDEKSCASLSKIAGQDAAVKVLLQSQQRGVSACRNWGLKEATGPFILFLDDDDSLAESALSISVAQLKAQPEADIAVLSSRLHPDSDKQSIAFHNTQQIFRLHPDFSYSTNPSWLLLFPPQINALLCRKSVFKDHHFDESLSFGEDIDLWWRLLQSGKKFTPRTHRATSFVRIHLSNTQRSIDRRALKAFLKKLLTKVPKDDKKSQVVLHCKIFLLSLISGSLHLSTIKGLMQNPLWASRVIALLLVARTKAFLRYYFRRLGTTG